MQSNWQETFFRGVALDAWRHILNPEMTRTEVDLLERVLGVESGARLLDVPCGNGRHAIELASRGYNMTGLDLSDEFIAEACNATSLPVRWVRTICAHSPGYPSLTERTALETASTT